MPAPPRSFQGCILLRHIAPQTLPCSPGRTSGPPPRPRAPRGWLVAHGAGMSRGCCEGWGAKGGPRGACPVPWGLDGKIWTEGCPSYTTGLAVHKLGVHNPHHKDWLVGHSLGVHTPPYKC